MTQNRDSDLAYADVDKSLGEDLYPGEQALAGEIARSIEEFIRRKYEAGHARRDAHPKAHGIVKAEFRVNDRISNTLAKGVFVPGKTYQAWIRFSNGLQDDDNQGDGRGMAIKLLGVPGKKILENDRNATTQDFVMFSAPVFFINDPQRYLSLVNETNSGNLWSRLSEAFTLGLQGFLIAAKLNSGTIANPLQVSYWSAVPYQLGIGVDRQAIKLK